MKRHLAARRRLVAPHLPLRGQERFPLQALGSRLATPQRIQAAPKLAKMRRLKQRMEFMKERLQKQTRFGPSEWRPGKMVPGER